MVHKINKNGTILRINGKKWYQNKLKMLQVKLKNGTIKFKMVLILTFMVHNKNHQKQYFPKKYKENLNSH